VKLTISVVPEAFGDDVFFGFGIFFDCSAMLLKQLLVNRPPLCLLF